MNSYGYWFFALQNRFNRVFQQNLLNNIQPGGPSRRHFSVRAILTVIATLLALVAAPGKSQAASLTSTPSSVSFGSVPLGNKITQTLAIKNAGTSTAVVSSYSISGSG